MIANINSAVEPPNQSLKNNRSATAAAPASTAGSAISNVIVDRLFDRLNDLSGASTNDPGKIENEQRANQYMEYARTSILGRPGVALAAQANQLPQTVLQLLQ